jgi:hypothetical protein
MYVWNKQFAIAALVLFVVLEGFLISQTAGAGASGIHPHTIQFILMNYSLLVVWVFIWMFDQARVRGANAWPWLLPLLVAPAPTLLAYVLYLQRTQRPS